MRLLLKFFLNSNTSSWLRDLEGEFDESTNSIRPELIRLEEAGFLKSEMSGNKKIYRANRKHPLFSDIHSLLLKHTGIDQVIESIVHKLGGLTEAWLTGSFAKGLDSPAIDILLIGQEIDRDFLSGLVERVEKLIHRKVRYVMITPQEKSAWMNQHPEAFLLWESTE